MVPDEDETLVEEREEEMVAFPGSEQPIKRIGWFLNPNSSSIATSPSPSFTSVHCKNSNFSKIQLRGWVHKLRDWNKWVEKLRPKYKDLWKKVGIFDAIITSTYRFRRDPSSLFGVVRFWCEETNTFLFRGGEATLTLEDVMILGGFSVHGEPVRDFGPLDDEQGRLESKMVVEMKKFNKTKCKKAEISIWAKHYLEEGDGNELEHIAFLALWLSRFVLVAPPARIIRYDVIPVAVRLARGERVALAPAVLASLYRDLSKMRSYLASDISSESTPLVVWAPLYILQLWIWERFTALRPKSSNFINSDEPRAARWHNAGKKMNYKFVRSVIMSRDEFQWRPYAGNLDDWCQPSYFRDVGGWACNGEDKGLESCALCLRGCELVGLDCIEQYLPHRVARQFGFDQDIPAFVPHAVVDWEDAWEAYDISVKDVRFYVPRKLFEAEVTVKYSIWWESVRKSLKRKREGKTKKKTVSTQCQKKKKGRYRRNDDLTISDWLARKRQCTSSKHGIKRAHAPSGVNASQDEHACVKNTEICLELNRPSGTSVTMKETQYSDNGNLTIHVRLARKRRRLSSEHGCKSTPQPSMDVTGVRDQLHCANNTKMPLQPRQASEPSVTMKQDHDDLNGVLVENGTVMSSTVLVIDDEGVAGDINETSARESVPDSILPEDIEENFAREEIEERTIADDRSSEDVLKQDAEAFETGRPSLLDIAGKGIVRDIKGTSSGELVWDLVSTDDNEESFEVETIEDCFSIKDKMLENVVERDADTLGNVRDEDVAVISKSPDDDNKGVKEGKQETSTGESAGDFILIEDTEDNFEVVVIGDKHERPKDAAEQDDDDDDDDESGNAEDENFNASDIKETSAAESVCDHGEIFRVEEVEQKATGMDKRFEDIERLKKEIAAIQARMKEMQSRAQVHH